MAQTSDQPDKSADQPQPGVVISPGSPPAQPPVAAPVPVADPEVSPSEPPEPPDAPFDDGDDQKVTWTASEFIAHDKSIGWYVVLALVTLVLAAAVFLLDKDLVSVSVVIIGGVLLGVYAGHQPRPLDYTLNNRGIGIGQKHYTYDDFKSFSIMKEGAFSSLMFIPLKRFAVAITVHYPPEDEARILSILSGQLPMEEHRYDAVDTLMRRIRF